jgi:F-type H+-transporting ATPase subunit delta
MSEYVISTRYAKALMSISEEKGTFDAVVKDVSFVRNTIEQSKELRIFLKSPIITDSKKLDVLKEVFQSHIGEELNNFLIFLVEKGRENILQDICNRFIALSNKKLNQVDVDVISAIELSETQKQNIKSRLELMIGKKIVAGFDIDNNIIGGFKARFNDTVIDASIQHQLELLKKKLFEEDFLKN